MTAPEKQKLGHNGKNGRSNPADKNQKKQPFGLGPGVLAQIKQKPDYRRKKTNKYIGGVG